MFILQRRHISYCISIYFLVGMNMHKALKRNHECVKGEICRPLQVNIKQTKRRIMQEKEILIPVVYYLTNTHCKPVYHSFTY